MGDLSKYFNRSEFECKCGCGESFTISPKLLDWLDGVRTMHKGPVNIASGFRCDKYNKKVGGVDDSSHKKGLAADIRVSNSAERFSIIRCAILIGFKRIGVDDAFVHLDIDQDKPQGVSWIYPHNVKD